MFVPRSPRFRLRWFRPTLPPLPSWLTDDAWIPPGNQEVYASARMGLFAILDNIEGETALLPEFLPTGVVSVFYQAGFDVECYPVSRDFSLPVSRVQADIRELAPDVVLFVHYFGFAAPSFPALAASAREAGAFVIEDAARGLFARDGDGRLLGSIGDAAIFSFHKVLPVPNGGLAVAGELALPAPSERVTDYRALAVGAAVTGARLFDWSPPVRPVQRTELSTDDPSEEIERPDTLSAPGRFARLGLARCDPDEIRVQRLSRYTALRDHLVGVDGLEVLTPEPHEGACPYGVALLVHGGMAARDAAFSALLGRGLPADVFGWPITFAPARADEFPDAAALRGSTLVIPTHQQLPESAIELIVETLVANLDGDTSPSASDSVGALPRDGPA